MGAGARDKPEGECRQWVHGLKLCHASVVTLKIEVQEKSPARGFGVSPNPSFSPQDCGSQRGLIKII